MNIQSLVFLHRLIGLGYCGTEVYKDAVAFLKFFELFCLGSQSNRSLKGFLCFGYHSTEAYNMSEFSKFSKLPSTAEALASGGIGPRPIPLYASVIN